MIGYVIYIVKSNPKMDGFHWTASTGQVKQKKSRGRTAREAVENLLQKIESEDGVELS